MTGINPDYESAKIFLVEGGDAFDSKKIINPEEEQPSDQARGNNKCNQLNINLNKATQQLDVVKD